ncbi:MAG: AMP-binding protein [Acidobacteriota bacterium]|nr:AMP-binding protein [Acidobacteriota bacterium]
MNIARHINTAAVETPDRTAVFFGDSVITYGALNRMSDQMAARLQQRGLGRGARVALFLPNGPGFIAAYLGILKAGMVAVSINPTAKPAEVDFILTDCGAAALLTANRPGAMVSDVPPTPAWVHVVDEKTLAGGPVPDFEMTHVSDDEAASILYTSGTTGRPKGVVLTHGNLAANKSAFSNCLTLGSADKALLFLPLTHAYGQNAVLQPCLEARASIVLQNGFQPADAVRAVADHRVSLFFGVPVHFIGLLGRKPGNLSSLRLCFSAASTLPAEIADRWRALTGCSIVQGYGMTESTALCTYNKRPESKPESVGTAMQGMEVRIVDPESGALCRPGAPGELIYRGAYVMKNYWGREEETAGAIVDGWFHSGDLATMDEDGDCFIVDRLKDVIDVGGLKVFPAEVENVLYQHPAVAEAAVFGLPDTGFGEAVGAVVVPVRNRQVTVGELSAFARQRLEEYKAPAHIDLVDTILKNPTGKVLKHVLRKVNPPTTANRHIIANWITEWILALPECPPPPFPPEANWKQLLPDSQILIQLAGDLSFRLDRKVSPSLFWEYSTIDSLARYLAETPTVQETSQGDEPTPKTGTTEALIAALEDAVANSGKGES